jgi:type VI secretion system secreted protein VgrG
MVTQRFLRAFLEAKDFDTSLLQVKRLESRERMNHLFEIDVVAVVPNAEMTARRGGDAEETPVLSEVVGAGVTITFRMQENVSEAGIGVDLWRDVRAIHGVVQSATDHVNADTGDVVLTMRILPRAHILSMVETFEVFLEQSLPDIIKSKLENGGFAEGTDYELRLTGTYDPIDFVVQYRETDLAFLSRLAEHYGLAFFFDHSGERDKIVFSDHQAAFKPVAEPAVVPVLRKGDHSTPGVHDVQVTRKLLESLYVQLDYNYRRPQTDLTSQTEIEGAFGGGIVEYAAHYRSPEDGERFARIRAEERRANEVVYRGKSTLANLVPGHGLQLEDDVRFTEADLLLVDLSQTLEQPANLHDSSLDAPHYENHFVALPRARTFRPSRVTPRPRIHGVLHAIVDPLPNGEIGEFANLDPEGRYTVRFFFDTAGSTRQVSSKRLRMVQMHAGLHYGAHMPLKPGIEVIVAFVDGDPDRPVIVGSIPNPVTPSPVTSANPTMNRFRTVSGILVEMKDRG